MTTVSGRSRNAFALCLALAITVAPWSGKPAQGAPEAREAAASETARQALDSLIAGNQRYVTGTLRHAHQNAARRQSLVGAQHPIATILGCSDSRVPVELLFDQGLGDLFVVRVAGNVAGMAELGSVEYAVHHLHTPLVLVLGHESCGAVTSALMPDSLRAREARGIQALLSQILPSLKGVDPTLSEAERVHRGVEANVRWSVNRLEQTPDLMNPHEGAPPVIVGAVYELDTGKVRILQ